MRTKTSPRRPVELGLFDYRLQSGLQIAQLRSDTRSRDWHLPTGKASRTHRDWVIKKIKILINIISKEGVLHHGRWPVHSMCQLRIGVGPNHVIKYCKSWNSCVHLIRVRCRSTHDLNHVVFSHYIVYGHPALQIRTNWIMLLFLGMVFIVQLHDFHAAWISRFTARHKRSSMRQMRFGYVRKLTFTRVGTMTQKEYALTGMCHRNETTTAEPSVTN